MSDGSFICVGCGVDHGEHRPYGAGYMCYCDKCREEVVAHNKKAIKYKGEEIFDKFRNSNYLKDDENYTEAQINDISTMVNQYFDECMEGIIK